MPAWLIPAIAQGAATVGNYFMNRKNKTPRFEDTATGRYLKRVSKRGAYSDRMQQTVASQAARGASAIANTQQSDIRGYLAARGLDKSIVGARALSEPQNKVQEVTAGAAENIALENEQSKIDAQAKLAAGTDQYRMARQQERTANTQNLVSGMANAAGTAVGGYYQNRARMIGEQEAETRLQLDTDKANADIQESLSRADWYKSQAYNERNPTQKPGPVSSFIQNNLDYVDFNNPEQSAKRITQMIPGYDYNEVLDEILQAIAVKKFGGNR